MSSWTFGVHRSVERRAVERPEAVAVVAGDATLTFEALNARANQLARHLRGLGVGPEIRVAIFADRTVATIVGMLAVLKSGGCYLPLDPSYPVDRLRFMLDDSDPRVVLTCGTAPDHGALFTGRRARVDLGSDAAAWHDLPSANLDEVEPSGRHLAYIIYTSGSTGRPKAVGVEHDGLRNLVHAQIDYFQVGGDSRVLQVASFNFDASVSEIFMALCSGAALYLAPPGALLVGDALANALDTHAISHVTLTPTVLETLPASAALASVKTLIAAGEALSAAAVRRWANGRRLLNAYGPTEATVCASGYECRATDSQDPAIGTPIANVAVYILDGSDRALAAGEPGEIYIGGAGVARGYLGRPELTAERFVPDPFAAQPGARMFKTGDLGRLRAGGNLEFLGRDDHQIKIRGIRIELGEIEAALSAHPAVQQARVVVRDRATGDKELVAYYVKQRDAVTDATALHEHLSHALPEYMVPAGYVALSALPFTPNGKLDVEALRNPAHVAYAAARYEAPVGALEQAIAGFWAEVLRVQRVGRDDDFFKLGGNSLRAMMVISRIRAALSQDASVHQLFAHTVLRSFAQALAATHTLAAQPQVEAVAERAPVLAAAPKRMWLVSQLEGASKAYHISIGPTSWMMPSGLRLTGALDRGALRRALDALLERHESLRATFSNANGDLALNVAGTAPGFALHEHDLRGRHDQQSALYRLKRDEVDAPFDLARGPLIRGALIQLADDEHVLQLTTHHAVCDGWSAELLLEELGALYTAFHNHHSDPLPPLPIGYTEYTARQHEWLTEDVLGAQADYWKATLADAPASLELPTDRPRPPLQSFAGDIAQLALDETLSDELKRFSARHGTTLYATLLAAWAGLLGRLANQQDLVIGTPFSGRTRPESERLIGCFINTVALRIDLSGEPTVADLLARVTRTALDAQRYQDLPFDRVVEVVDPPRDLSRSPVFQVLFAWQNHAFGKLELPDLRVTSEDALGASAKFDLELRLGEAGGRITGVLEFATSLFDRATIERHLEYFQAVLRAMVQDDHQAMSRIDLLGDAQRRQLAAEWTAADAAAVAPRCVHTLFEEQAARQPEAIAVIHGDRQVTFAALDAKASRLASALHSLGVGPDTRVAICVDRSIEMVAGVLGILKAGGTYVPLDPAYPADRLVHMVLDSQAQVLLVDTQTPLELRDQLRRASPIPVIELNGDAVQHDGRAGTAAIEPTPQHLAYAIFTSGSTGTPKGAGLSHEALFHLLTWQLASDEPRTTLQFTPLSFDVSFQEIFSTLCAGAALVLIDNAARQDPHKLFQIIRAHHVQRLFVPFVALQMLAGALADASDIDCSLQEVITAGEQLRVTPALAKLFARWKTCRLFNHYGPTESHVVTAYAMPGDTAAWPALPPIGRPLPHARIYVLDAHGQPVPQGVIGELHIAGPVLARGYLQQPAWTAERFVPDPFAARPGARMYKTGDLARHRADGELEFLGRNDAQVKIRGFRIELGEIEGRLAAHPAVKAAVVDVRGDGPNHKRLVAYYVANGPVAVDALKAALATTLPEYMRPATYVALDRLPLTPSGKVNRRALPDPPSRVADSAAPVGKVETRIAGLWAEILEIDQVNRDENFFELGGHSLLATILLIKIRAEFGVELVLEDLFKAPALMDFARVVIIKQLELLQAARA